MPAAIELNAVGVRIGARDCLADVSLRAASGEILILKGDNGAGKTTLLRVLARQLVPTHGNYQLHHANRAQIGFLPQHLPLYPPLSATAQLMLAAKLYGADAASIAGWLARYGLTPHAHRALSGFSRGMAQRIALIQAMLHAPTLLLLDEPTTALDPSSTEVLLALLREQRGARLTIVATHDESPFLPIADRLLQLRDGQLVQSVDLKQWRQTFVVRTVEPISAAQLRFDCVAQLTLLDPHSARIELRDNANAADLGSALHCAGIAVAHLAAPVTV